MSDPMREALTELYDFVRGMNDFRPDSSLGRKVRAAIAQPATAPSERDALRAALQQAHASFEYIRLMLLKDLEEPRRSAFWKAVEGRNAIRDINLAQQPAAVPQNERGWVSPIKTIADLVSSLLTLDQGMNVFGAYHIDNAPTSDRCRARGLSLSLEHVIRDRIKTCEKTVPFSLVIWTADQRVKPTVDITGWKLVPADPTEAMWQAGRSADIHPGDSYSKVWRAMWNEAPNVDDCETTSAPVSQEREWQPIETAPRDGMEGS